jgi:hypothetical protein
LSDSTEKTATTVETKAIKVEGEAIENPIFEGHKRGRNWVAVLTGKNAANMERRFLKSHGSTVDLTGVSIGSALEVGGDYISARGIRYPDRRYWRVTDLDEATMAVEVYASAAKLLKAVRESTIMLKKEAA